MNWHNVLTFWSVMDIIIFIHGMGVLADEYTTDRAKQAARRVMFGTVFIGFALGTLLAGGVV